ncbi:SRPBCC family protein [Streptomyces sp. 8N706]|uniref:SRPBCC family protein n=1 Tax=Streptomyces sp. 8N706 TaxID=3457416 RepID=UPI003FD3573D
MVSNDQTTRRLARGLGWVSLGLGAAQLAAPRAVSRVSGVEDSAGARATVPLVGVRELSHAAGLLGSREPAPWVWPRIAGDAADLALLKRVLRTRAGSRRRRAAAATAAVAGMTVLDVYTAFRAARTSTNGQKHEVKASITINRPRAEVYAFWRDLENLPRFMTHLKSVHTDGDGHMHWEAKAPVRSVEWDAEIVEDRPGELIAWRSLKGPANSGTVGFSDAPGGRGTEVHVHAVYEPPAGRTGESVARLFGENPEQQVRDDLRRFKQVMETGEVVRSEGSPEGTRARRLLRQRPARPHGRRAA